MKSIYKAKLRHIQELDAFMRYDGSPCFDPNEKKTTQHEGPRINKQQARRVGNWLRQETMSILNVVFDKSK